MSCEFYSTPQSACEWHRWHAIHAGMWAADASYTASWLHCVYLHNRLCYSKVCLNVIANPSCLNPRGSTHISLQELQLCWTEQPAAIDPAGSLR
jgi:hypothetical protein